jgi:uncharacterized membrane protein
MAIESGMAAGTAARLAKMAGALALIAGAALAQEQGQERDRCYGVALAGENDGLDRREDPGSSTVDYQGNAWVMVPQGTCMTMPLPAQPDGTPRRGALEPLDRDRP